MLLVLFGLSVFSPLVVPVIHWVVLGNSYLISWPWQLVSLKHMKQKKLNQQYVATHNNSIIIIGRAPKTDLQFSMARVKRCIFSN